MTEQTTITKKPSHIAYAVRAQGGNVGPLYTKIGVAFPTKSGGFSVMYDAMPLRPQIVLIEPDADKPAEISYGPPTRRADYQASMVRDGSKFWTTVGAAYLQEGYVSIFLDAIPHGKFILSLPKDAA